MADTFAAAAPVAGTVKRAASQSLELRENECERKGRAAEKGNDGDKQFLSRCLVYCRVRPMNKTDCKDGGFKLVTVEKDSIFIKNQRRYDFDGVFDEDCTQRQVFESVAVPCIEHAFDGFCSALMCYGQTGTGKSYTMCNTNPGAEGIIPRSAKHIFEKIATNTQRQYRVVGQFVQIYRDHLGDLMVGSGKERVDIRCDADDGVELTGCSSHVLQSAREFMHFYHSGNERRVVTATAMNPESSRGHTALVIRITSEKVNDPGEGQVSGKITFIDLAGYERFSKTGISHDNPIMRDEAKCINASLLSLGHVVSALSTGGRHIPWRNSKLTRILQDSIGGRSRTSIILTIGPSSDHLHETTNSLQFGLRAMDVKVSAKQSVTVNYQKLAHKLQLLLDEQTERINALELQIASRDAERNELMERYDQQRKEVDQRFESDLAKLRANKGTEEEIQNLRELYKAELENLQEQRQEEIQYQEEAHSMKITTLIREQTQREAKCRAEMRLTQERIIEDFQRKLDASREGKNDDLIKALRQLSEKDSLLACRANDAARLHAHIEVLTEQIKEMGGTPEVEAVFPETFLDVGQVEEIQQRLEAEVERYREKGVALCAEVERLSNMCTERLKELNTLRDENNELRQYIKNSGIDLPETDELSEFLRERCTKMVDSTELETLRVTMQASIDELMAHNAELMREVVHLKEERSQISVPLTARIRGTCLSALSTARRSSPTRPQMTPGQLPRTLRQFFQHGNELKLPTSLAEADGVQKALKQVTDQLTQSLREKNSLEERVQTLEATLAAQDTQPLKPYVPPINLKLSDVPVAPVISEKFAQAPAHTDIEVLLRVKDDELDALLETIERQEYLLAAARSNEEFHQQVINELNQTILAAQLEPLKHTISPPPVDSIAMDDYMNILRVLRDGERRMAARLVERKNHDPVEIEALLEERDHELQMKDELVIEKASKAQFVAKVCIRLKSQLESLDVTPCCQLPESYRDLVDREEDEMYDQIGFQRELEDQLRAQEEEKHRLKKMLNFLKEEREKDATAIKSTQERCREAEEREALSTGALQRLLKEKSQKEMVLEKSLRYLTLQLKEQEERQKRDSEKSRYFGRFFKWLRSN